MDETTYDIQELVDLSGVSRRNIYFYVQQGVLPPPQGAGLAARYQVEHLLRLRLIPFFRREGLRLDQIRHKFETADPAALRRLLEEQPPALPPAASPLQEMKLPPLPMPAVPRSLAETSRAAAACRRYDLPGDMILIVPEKISMDDSLRLEKILEAAGIPSTDLNGAK